MQLKNENEISIILFYFQWSKVFHKNESKNCDNIGNYNYNYNYKNKKPLFVWSAFTTTVIFIIH